MTHEVMELVVVIEHAGRRATRLAAEASPTQYVQVTLDGRRHKELIKMLLGHPESTEIISIPDTAISEDPYGRLPLDEVWLTDEVVDAMTSLLPPYNGTQRDRGFLRSNLTKLVALSNNANGPDSIIQLRASSDGALNAASLCAMVDRCDAWEHIRQNTQLHMGPRSIKVLRDLAMVLRIYHYPPNPAA